MSATWLNGGIDYAAQLFLGKTGFQTLTTRLFTNNHAPVVTDTFAAFTECALAGYAAVAMVPASWAGATAGGVAAYTHVTITFTFNAYAGGTTIYGYVTTIPGVIGVLADLLSTPYVVPAGGGSLTLDIPYGDRGY